MQTVWVFVFRAPLTALTVLFSYVWVATQILPFRGGWVAMLGEESRKIVQKLTLRGKKALAAWPESLKDPLDHAKM